MIRNWSQSIYVIRRIAFTGMLTTDTMARGLNIAMKIQLKRDGGSVPDHNPRRPRCKPQHQIKGPREEGWTKRLVCMPVVKWKRGRDQSKIMRWKYESENIARAKACWMPKEVTASEVTGHKPNTRSDRHCSSSC